VSIKYFQELFATYAYLYKEEASITYF